MSIKPKYALQILAKEKKYELRRYVGSIEPGSRIILYASKPICALIGEFKAGRVRLYRPEEVVEMIKLGALIGCSEDDVEYVIGRRKVLVIEVVEPIAYTRRISLSELRESIPDFRPPLSYVRIKKGSILEKILEIVEPFKP